MYLSFATSVGPTISLTTTISSYPCESPFLRVSSAGFQSSIYYICRTRRLIPFQYTLFRIDKDPKEALRHLHNYD